MPRKPDTRTASQKAKDYVYNRLRLAFESSEEITGAQLGETTTAIRGHLRNAALFDLIREGVLVKRTTRPESGKGPNITHYKFVENMSSAEIAAVDGEEPDTPEMQAIDAALRLKYRQ